MIKRVATLVISLLSLTAQAQNVKPVICVWDVLGKSGDVYNLMLDQSLHMGKLGMPFELRPYTDERVAFEDYRAGQCAGLVATGFRVRAFNAITGSIDSMGSGVVVHDRKVDMAASYDVLRRIITVFSSEQGAKLMREGNHEIGGMLPVGAVYPMIKDRSTTQIDQLAGKRIGVFDQDKSQALLIQQLGAQAVSVDISNVGTKFNNDLLDVIHLPAIAYIPFELAKGMGSRGTVVRIPVMLPTFQFVFNAEKMPAGFGDASRKFWLSRFDRQMQIIQRAEASIPPKVWSDVAPDVLPAYIASLKQGRITAAKQGLFAKRTLNLLKKTRCSINSSNAECATATEVE